MIPVTPQDITLIFMILIRASALLMSIPIFTGRLVPMRLRLSIAIILAVISFPFVEPVTFIPSHVLDLVVLSGKETLIGLLMGLAVRLVFFIMEFAGHIISTEVGLMMSTSFDPVSASSSTTISSLLFYLTTLVFLITGMHREIFLAFQKSFEYVPIANSLYGLQHIESLVKASTQIFSVGLQIAAPLMALNFVITVSFAVLGKAAPKVNVFMLSFSVRILGGLALLLMSLGLITQYIYEYVKASPERMLEFLVQ